MGDTPSKKKVVIQVAPKPIMVKKADADGSAIAHVFRPFWNSTTLNHVELIGPPALNTPLDSPYSHDKLPALTVEEQFNFLFNQMGFTKSPSWTPIWDPDMVGKKVGPDLAKGYDVYAAIQVVDAEGHMVYVGYGAYTGGGDTKPHGEEMAMGDLRARLPKDGSLRGGRLITTVTQCPCGEDKHNCAGQLDSLATEYGLTLETWVPERDSVRPGALKPVGPKTASREAQRTDRPAVRYKRLTLTERPRDRSVGIDDGGDAPIGKSPADEELIIGTPGFSEENVNTAFAVLWGINLVSNMIADDIQKAALEAELERVMRDTRKIRRENPKQWMLLVFRFQQVEAPWFSPIQPGSRFLGIDYYFGNTQAEALQHARSNPGLYDIDPNAKQIYQQTWLPPR